MRDVGREEKVACSSSSLRMPDWGGVKEAGSSHLAAANAVNMRSTIEPQYSHPSSTPLYASSDATSDASRDRLLTRKNVA